jgi:hypothetical protein
MSEQDRQNLQNDVNNQLGPDAGQVIFVDRNDPV